MSGPASLRVVVKLGTSVLTDGTPRLSTRRMLDITTQVAALHEAGHAPLVVSSGAQAAGRDALGSPSLGRDVPSRQMFAAVGMPRLMQRYSDLFALFDIQVAQVLLTRGDLNDRARYLNARDTLLTLLAQRVVPVINENDTVAVDEIKVGDNDNLSALVANVADADLLIILTDQPGLYTADPRRDTAAQLIARVDHIDQHTYALAGGAGTTLGTGGMATKIQAAQLAARSGITTVIAAGREPEVLGRVVAGELVGTRFDANPSPDARRRWLLAERPRGTLIVDDGAAQVLLRGGASLLPVGVTHVEGTFERGAVLAVRGPTPDAPVIAHGLSQYSSTDLARLCRQKSSKIADLLGYTYGDAAIHRNNMVLLT